MHSHICLVVFCLLTPRPLLNPPGIQGFLTRAPPGQLTIADAAGTPFTFVITNWGKDGGYGY